MRRKLCGLLAAIVWISLSPVAGAAIFQHQSDITTGLSMPAGAAVDGNGNLFVSDFVSNTVLVFDPNHQFVRSFGSGFTAIAISGSTQYMLGSTRVVPYTNDVAGTPFAAPSPAMNGSRGLATDGNFVYVADTANSRIVKYTVAGSIVTTFGGGLLSSPYGVAIGADTDIYVADSFHDLVQVFDSNGGFLRSFSSVVPAWPSNHPSGLALDKAGNIFMHYDAGVAAFSNDGALLEAYSGSGAGAFDRGTSVALDGNTFYATDIGHSRVQVFDISGIEAPEPATLGILAAGTGMLLARRRRASRRQSP